MLARILPRLDAGRLGTARASATTPRSCAAPDGRFVVTTDLHGARSRLPARVVDAVRARLEGRRDQPHRRRGDGRAPDGARRRHRGAARRPPSSLLEGIADGLPRGPRPARARRRSGRRRPLGVVGAHDRGDRVRRPRGSGRDPAVGCAGRRRRRARRGARRRGARASRLLFGEATDATGEPDRERAAALRARHPELVAAQLAPSPPVSAGVAAALAGATAMLDVSDGLARDARRIAEASGVGLDFDSAALGADVAARARRRRRPRPARHVPAARGAARGVRPHRQGRRRRRQALRRLGARGCRGLGSLRRAGTAASG